jgi:hypothetical protein
MHTDTCPMCGQALLDEQAARRVRTYEKRVEARLTKELEPRVRDEMQTKHGQERLALQHQVDDLKRKLEAKSSRALGEEQQDALLSRLQRAFPGDEIVLIGDNGTGDILQTVCDGGREVGRILHESKNTKQWQNTWIAKIREDGEVRRATHLVIVSRRLPRGVTGHCERDGVLVCQPDYAVGLTHVLRMWMIASYVEDGDTAPDEHLLWDYLGGDEFQARLDALRNATSEEDAALVAEERAHKRWWDDRARRAGTVRSTVASIVGDIKDIADGSQDHEQGFGSAEDEIGVAR